MQPGPGPGSTGNNSSAGSGKLMVEFETGEQRLKRHLRRQARKNSRQALCPCLSGDSLHVFAEYASLFSVI